MGRAGLCRMEMKTEKSWKGLVRAGAARRWGGRERQGKGSFKSLSIDSSSVCADRTSRTISEAQGSGPRRVENEIVFILIPDGSTIRWWRCCCSCCRRIVGWRKRRRRRSRSIILSSTASRSFQISLRHFDAVDPRSGVQGRRVFDYRRSRLFRRRCAKSWRRWGRSDFTRQTNAASAVE